MPTTIPFTGSAIGRKAIMAVSGVILFGFVLVHMAGNLQAYLGREAFNAYAEFLRAVLHGAGLWIARATLLLAVLAHVWAAWATTQMSRAARPVGYERWEPRASTYSSRTMRWGGVIILLFVIYHLMHFTFGNAHPDFIPGDAYHNFVTGFEDWPVAAVYIVANVVLGFHLRHGVWSMLQTLGLSHPRYKRLAVTAALVFALVVTLGNLSFPIAVLAGVIAL
jgi:succinate dehydrogenase / fumarate reductase, cytochrome b subunit